MKWSNVVWGLVLAALMGWAAIAALGGFLHQAMLNHSSDVYRDDVMEPFAALEKAGAIDLDKAAAAMGVAAYAGSSAAERERWEDHVNFRTMFFLTNDVVQRVESDWAVQSVFCFVTAGVGVIGVVATWVALRSASTPTPPSGSAIDRV